MCSNFKKSDLSYVLEEDRVFEAGSEEGKQRLLENEGLEEETRGESGGAKWF